MIGRTLSHYEIVGEIGAGGMGVVYRARDTLLGRTVALKILPADSMADESRQRRFLQEARAASALNHPSIVTIHDVLHVDGVHAIVMELVEGTSLQSRLEKGPLPPKQVLTISRQIADALAAAHAAGIVHRDLKPANVMITDRGVAKVLDFGIAKLDPMRGADGDATQTAALTMMGAVVGTAAYMSPEQARGEPIDGRSDVFSLGVVMYQMVTGRSPFAASTITGVLHKLLYEEPPDLATHHHDLPPGLSSTVQRALAKQPSERFQSMEAVCAVLDDLSAGRTTAEMLPVQTASRESVSNRPVKLAAVALGVIVIVATAGWGWRAGWFERADRASDDSVKVELPATPFEAYSLGQSLLGRYDRDGYVDKSVESFQRAIDLRPDYAAAQAGLAMAYWRKYREQRDRMWLEYADTNARRAVQLDPQLALGMVALAYASVERGEHEAAEEAITRALTLDGRNPDAMAARAYLRLQQRKPQEAIEAVRQAIALRPDDWSLRLMEGVILLSVGQPREAVTPLERASALAPDSSLVLRNLGAAYHAVNRYDDATTAFQRALEIKPDPAVYTNLGTLFFYRGLYDQAIVAFDRAVQLRPNDFRMWGNLADAYRLTAGRSTDAAQAYTRGLQLLDEQLAKSPESVDLGTRRIIMLAKNGNCTGSGEAITALDLSRASFTELYRVAVAREVCKDRDRAIELLTKSIEAGYSLDQVNQDPELIRLREDVRFHRFLSARSAGAKPPATDKR